jgi:predicted RNase H-related nuclease YkuK (DUF458 family)
VVLKGQFKSEAQQSFIIHEKTSKILSTNLIPMVKPNVFAASYAAGKFKMLGNHKGC